MSICPQHIKNCQDSSQPYGGSSKRLIRDKVAIKILEKDKIKDHSDIERINREITILKKVRHPHVV